MRKLQHLVFTKAAAIPIQRRVGSALATLIAAAFFLLPFGAFAQEAASGNQAAAQDGYLYIAGLVPSARPEAAPVVTSYDKTGAWYEHALFGVSKPYPHSLKFLEDQGAWWTPFIHPGMSGPYDIRGWHAAN